MEATETRKEEAAAFSQSSAQNNAALTLLDMAKNQLNKSSRLPFTHSSDRGPPLRGHASAIHALSFAKMSGLIKLFSMHCYRAASG